MDAIAAVIVGGTSMSGGTGNISGTFIGCLIIGFLNNGLNLMNVDSFWQYVITGIVILLAVLIDFLRSKKQIRQKKKNSNRQLNSAEKAKNRAVSLFSEIALKLCQKAEDSLKTKISIMPK